MGIARPISRRRQQTPRALAPLAMLKPAHARWTIVFDPEGLSAADVRMLTAVIEADLRLALLAADPSDSRAEETLVRNVAQGLSARFPHVAFRVVQGDQWDR
jgi:hypothetical protein